MTVQTEKEVEALVAEEKFAEALLILEKAVQVAADEGSNTRAPLYIEDMVDVCRKMGDKPQEATRAKQAAVMYHQMNQSKDALRMAREAASLYQSLGLTAEFEDARKLQTSIYVKKDQHKLAPHREEALAALKSFVKAIENRDHTHLKDFEAETSLAIKDSEMFTALEALFERDPEALSFLEGQGWNLDSFKSPSKIYQYPHEATYLNYLAGGMNFGPQFRPCHLYRKGFADMDGRAMSVNVLPDTDSWQGQMMFRPGMMDAGLQTTAAFSFPPN